MIDLKLVLELVKIGHLSQEVSSLPDIQYLLETLKSQGHRIRCHSSEWNKITDKLPINDIIGLAKGLTIMESNFDDWFNGSVSPIIWIFRTVQGKNERMGNDLVDWILPRTRNPYVPFGSQNYGARSLAEYHQKNLLHKEMIRRGIADIKDNEEKAKRDREIRRSQRLISAEDRVTGKRKLFLNELNQLNITDQLIRLSEDNKYSAKYYPTRIRFIPDLPVQDRLQNSSNLINQIKSKYGKPIIVLSGRLDDYSSLLTKAKLASDFFFLLPFKLDAFLLAIEKCFEMLPYFDSLHFGGKSMSLLMEKNEAHKMIDRLPANATWDDLMREIYVREAIERGLGDSKEGRTRDVKEIRAKYGLPAACSHA